MSALTITRVDRLMGYGTVVGFEKVTPPLPVSDMDTLMGDVLGPTPPQGVGSMTLEQVVQRFVEAAVVAGNLTKRARELSYDVVAAQSKVQGAVELVSPEDRDSQLEHVAAWRMAVTRLEDTTQYLLDAHENLVFWERLLLPMLDAAEAERK